MSIIANLVIDQGSDFTSNITLEDNNGIPMDLSNFGIRGQIRKTYTSSVFYDFTCIKTGATQGKFRISLTSIQTSSLKSGRYVYDIEIFHITANNDVTRVVEGQVIVTPGVTR